MNSALMFSKASDEWSTPLDFYAELNKEFQFNFDVAATRENAKCYSYFGPDAINPAWRDALRFDHWNYVSRGPFWMNPPYSKCREFMAKAAAEAARGCCVVCLVPSRTDTRWWHEYVWDHVKHQPRPRVEVRFVKGRLKFGEASAGAPFPSVVVVFHGGGGA